MIDIVATPSFHALLIAIALSAAAAAQTDPLCPITPPNEFSPPGERLAWTGVGNGALWTSLWPDGTIVFRPGGPGFVLPDGALKMKQGWWRKSLDGRLMIEGKRLDGPAPPLRYQESGLAEQPVGFNPSYLIFPTPGCWEITGRVGTDSLTLATRVVKIGEGPARP
jgi:hypothetical protein